MAGVESNRRNLQNEDRSVDQNIRRHEREIAEGEFDPPDTEESEMDIMAARDVTIYQGVEPPKPQPTLPDPTPEPTLPVPTPVPAPPPPAPKKSLASKLAPYVATGLIAAGLGTGATAGLGAAYLLGKSTVKDTNTDTVVEYTPGFGTPEERE